MISSPTGIGDSQQIPLKKLFDAAELFITSKEDFDEYLEEHNRLDVLHIVGSRKTVWPPEGWFFEKLSRWSSRLNTVDLKAKAVVGSVLGQEMPEHVFFEYLVRMAPRVIVSRAFSVSASKFGWLARRMPNTTFIQVNHTPNSFTVVPGVRGPLATMESIEYATSIDNYYHAVVSESDAEALKETFPKAKVLFIANPCETFLDHEKAAIMRAENNHRDYFNIALGGRANIQKNFKNQLDAIGLLSKKYPVVLYLLLAREQMEGMRDEILEYARRLTSNLNIPFKFVDFMNPGEFAEFAASNIDLMTHVAFDESFGYLPWEVMSIGIPVVGSPGMPCASLIAEPSSIGDIAEQIEAVIKDKEKFRTLSIEKAKQIEEEANNVFDNVFNQLLG